MSADDGTFRGYQVQVFAKAPLPGRVKTRMMPPLTPEQCAALHGELLAHCLGKLRASKPAPLVLACGEPHPFLDELAARHAVPTVLQRGRDLGERMYRAVVAGLECYRGVILVGGDCPFVDGAYLEEAISALENGAPVVIGPADDGGYVLVGATCRVPAMFEEVPWGSSEVLAVTRQRLRAQGCDWHELAPLPDIDRPEDLALLQRLPGLAHWASVAP